MESISFDETERAAIVAEYDRQARQPHVANLSPMGCVLMVIGVVIVLVIPKLGLPIIVGRFLLVVVTLMILSGLILELFFGGGYALRRASKAPRAALDWIEKSFDSGTPDERRQAAVTAIGQAYYTSGGPWTAATYDVASARRRLGSALAYVRAVEGVLVSERKIYRVFTAEDKEVKP